jgi:hypothetical protein
MKLYWGLKSVPELQGLPKAQQKRLWRIGMRAGLRMPVVWGGFLLMAIIGGVGIFLLPPLLPNLLDSSMSRILWSGMWGGLGGFVSSQVTTTAIRPVLARHRQAMEAKPAKDGSYYVPPAL